MPTLRIPPAQVSDSENAGDHLLPSWVMESDLPSSPEEAKGKSRLSIFPILFFCRRKEKCGEEELQPQTFWVWFKCLWEEDAPCFPSNITWGPRRSLQAWLCSLVLLESTVALQADMAKFSQVLTLAKSYPVRPSTGRKLEARKKQQWCSWYF